jgi:hypothetical protein
MPPCTHFNMSTPSTESTLRSFWTRLKSSANGLDIVAELQNDEPPAKVTRPLRTVLHEDDLLAGQNQLVRPSEYLLLRMTATSLGSAASAQSLTQKSPGMFVVLCAMRCTVRSL